MPLTTNQFDYPLKEKLIAQKPASPRDSARLMLINRQTGSISHHLVSDLPSLLPPDYDLIANNTKVFPARIIGYKNTGGRVEILLIKKQRSSRFVTITSPGLKEGTTINLSPLLSSLVLSRQDRLTTLLFSLRDPLLTEELARIGTMPTPPYIKKMLKNPHDYQTIYAKYGFSAAAPTAGLHFTNSLLARLKERHRWHELTLNVGLGTFLPVQVEQLATHKMHTEDYTLTPHTAQALAQLKNSGRRLLAIGTTTVRCLEASLGHAGHSSTSIFLYPPYKFQMVDALLTNFHLPRSTLLMLVSAFTSFPQTNQHFTTFQNSLLGRAYAEAIKEKYRFFSFGDAMLIL